MDDGFLRGHGTRVADGRLLATVCGTVERVNKLVSVRPLRTRYVPETGDVVLGRVVDIAGKRWKLDIGGRQDAVLQLGAVHLPGGAQRRRNAVDELNMRSLYKENDLISCEVQSFYADGAVALHTRSLKYGRLADGQLVRVPPTLVKRVKRHFHAIDAANAFGGDDGLAETTMSGNEMSDNKRKREHTGDVEVLLGCNGFVWVGARSAATGELNDDELNARDEDDVKKKTERVQRVVSRAQRERVCRVANAVRVLSALFLAIHPPAIEDVSLCSVEWGTSPKDMLSHAFLRRTLERETERRLAKGGA